jgi:hypothetical protein
MQPPEDRLDEDFVSKLRPSTNIELACGCILVWTRR